MSVARNLVRFQFFPSPATGAVRQPARAVERPLFPTADGQRHQVRAIPVGTEAHQVSRGAPGTLNAMANPERHAAESNSRRSSGEALSDVSKISGEGLDVPGHQCLKLDVFGPRSSLPNAVRKRPGWKPKSTMIGTCCSGASAPARCFSAVTHDSGLASMFARPALARSALRRQVLHRSDWQPRVLSPDLSRADGEREECPLLSNCRCRSRSWIPPVPALPS